MLCDSIYTKCPARASPWPQGAVWCFPGVGAEEWGVTPNEDRLPCPQAHAADLSPPVSARQIQHCSHTGQGHSGDLTMKWA